MVGANGIENAIPDKHSTILTQAGVERRGKK